jgi:hypothetical protein
MSGRKIKVIEEDIFPEGYKIPPVLWRMEPLKGA